MTAQAQAEQKIRDAITRYALAIRTKNLDLVSALFADDIRAFDAIMALQFQGKAAYTEHWKVCMGYAFGTPLYEVHQLQVLVDNKLAVSHCLNHCGCENEKGEMQSSWMRSTQCWQQFGNDWKIVHEHFSAPFNPENGQALFDVKP